MQLFIDVILQTDMEKTPSQITLDFTAPAQQDEMASEKPFSKPEDLVILREEQIVPEKIEKPGKQKPLSTRGRRSLKDMGLDADLIQIPPDNILFQKQYYAIGEVAKMFRLNQSLLRFWETEFDILQPRKNGKGDRFFRPQDVKNLQLIHDLLRRRKFTIEGAKEYLKNNKKTDEKFSTIQSLERIKAFLLELKASL